MTVAKPLYFLVWVNGVQHRKDTRREARTFAALEKLKGNNVIIKAVGFES